MLAPDFSYHRHSINNTKFLNYIQFRYRQLIFNLHSIHYKREALVV